MPSATYNLSVIAQALREYDQARNDDQQALQIFIEYGDRDSQASTYRVHTSYLNLVNAGLDPP